MVFLKLVNQTSLVLGVLSFVYTLQQIYLKITLRKLQEELVSKIVTMMELRKPDEVIINILAAEGWPVEEIQIRINEIHQLTKFTAQKPQQNVQQQV